MTGGGVAVHFVDYVVLGGWIAFWVYWIAASRGVKATRNGRKHFVGDRVGLVLLVLLLVRNGAWKHSTTTGSGLLQGIGLVLFVLGLALAVWARIYIGNNWGTPRSEKVDPELVTTGPYRRVRHPIYSGIILAMIGTTIAVSLYWLIGAVVTGAYFAYSATVEEHNLANTFPETYPAYKRSSKMLIPFIF